MKYILIIAVLILSSCRTINKEVTQSKSEASTNVSDSLGKMSLSTDSLRAAASSGTNKTDSSITKNNTKVKVSGDSISYNANTGEVKVKNGNVEVESNVDKRDYSHEIGFFNMLISRMSTLDERFNMLSKQSSKKEDTRFEESTKKDFTELKDIIDKVVTGMIVLAIAFVFLMVLFVIKRK